MAELPRKTATRWQREEPAAQRNFALVSILLLAVILIWRLLNRKPLAARHKQRVSAAAERNRPGADSEFYQIEARLARAGCARAPHEPLTTWLVRIGRERAEINVAELWELLRLHYRYRFDPRGLSTPERAAFAAHVRRWLRTYGRPR